MDCSYTVQMLLITGPDCNLKCCSIKAGIHGQVYGCHSDMLKVLIMVNRSCTNASYISLSLSFKVKVIKTATGLQQIINPLLSNC